MPAKGSRKLTVKRAAEALRWAGGLLTAASLRCNVSRQTFYSFLAEHAELVELRHEIDDQLCDRAEAVILNAIKAGDLKAACYYLDRKGKHRGYGWKGEVTGRDGAPIEMEVVDARAELQRRLEEIAGRFDRVGEADETTRH